MPFPIDQDTAEIIARLNRLDAIKKRRAAINVEIAKASSQGLSTTSLEDEYSQLETEATLLRDGNGNTIRNMNDLLADGIS